MHKGFWGKLEKPIVALAPLANVTDAAFRRIVAKYSKPKGPDVMYTEFVSADGLFLGDKKGKGILMKDLIFTENERPIVAQFFTGSPDIMERAATLAVELGFDGVDINMGCPDKSVLKQGAGAALIKNPELARKLIRAAWKGTQEKIPVSVKTRIGYNKNEIEEWLPVLLEEKLTAVTFHLRSMKEMSKVSAHWKVMGRAVEIRNNLKSDTVLLGNGDIETMEEGIAKVEECDADGVMIGRGIFGNPWFFSNMSASDVNILEKKGMSPEERFCVMLEHTKLFEELLGDVKSFASMKKHFKAYTTGIDGAKELRIKLMETSSAQEVEQIIVAYMNSNGGNWGWSR